MKFSLLLFAVIALPAQPVPSPAQKRIELAQNEIKQAPTQATGYNRLALAFFQRARETSDQGFYEKGAEALKSSLKAEPNNREGRKLEARLALGQQEFAKALGIGQKLNAQAPDDTSVYEILADANVGLGNYDAAEKAVQTMFNLRLPSIPALTRASHLRDLFGDLEGAIEMMTNAYAMVSFDEREERAWMLTQIAQVERKRGRGVEAERLAREALILFPGYHYAVGALAAIKLDGGSFGEAVELERLRYDAARHPKNLYTLAVALDRAGQKQEAASSFRLFEEKARQAKEAFDNSNYELVFFYTGISANPKEALKVAQLEIARRKDVNTLDAYAWALFANGRYEDASREITRVMAVGVKDPGILKHAREIEAALANASGIRRSR